MTEAGKNIKLLRKALNLSARALSEKVGIPQRRIEAWERGTGSPKASDSKLISTFFGISTEALHDHVMTRDEGLKTILRREYAHRKVPAAVAEPATTYGGQIPVFEARATGGTGQVFNDLGELPAFHITVPGYEDCNFAMQVYGHSMYPTVENGCLVLCKQVTDKNVILWGELYVIITGDYRMVKRLQKSPKQQSITCMSDNEELRKNNGRRFEPIEVERDKIRALYLVKGIIKKTQP